MWILSAIISAGIGWLICHAHVARKYTAFKNWIDRAWILFTAAGVIISVTQYVSSSSKSLIQTNEFQASLALTRMQHEAESAADACLARSQDLKLPVAGKEERLCHLLTEQKNDLKAITEVIGISPYQLYRYQEDPSSPRGKPPFDFKSDYLRVNRTAPGTKSKRLCDAKDEVLAAHASVQEPYNRIVTTFGALCDVFREESERIANFAAQDKDPWTIDTRLLFAWFVLYAFFAGARVATVTMPAKGEIAEPSAAKPPDNVGSSPS